MAAVIGGASARLVWVPRVPRLRRRVVSARERFRRRRSRRSDSSSNEDSMGDAGLEIAGGCLDVGGEWAIAVVTVVAILVLAWFFLVPLLLLLVDAVVLVVVASAALVARILLRRPWRIEVARGEHVVGSVAVVGLGNARRRRDEVVAALAAGIDPATLVDAQVR
jgi:hypothetical protein